jgi:hypothetical protein
MSIPPEVLVAVQALTELFADQPDVVVTTPFGRPPVPHDLMGMVAEQASTAYRAVVHVNESFAMVEASGRFGFGLYDWSDRPEFGPTGLVKVEFPASPLTEDQPGWRAAVAERLRPVVEQARAAVAADRAEVQAR